MNELLNEKWRIWSEVSKFIEESTGDLFFTSDDLYKVIFESTEVINLEILIDELNKKEFYLRIENDEEYFYLSIIDRKVYPRVWADNFKENREIIIESTEHLIQRSVSGSEKDWIIRFSAKKIEGCIYQCFEWIKNNQK